MDRAFCCFFNLLFPGPSFNVAPGAMSGRIYNSLVMLTHLDSQGRPGMVDVADKAVTERTATARALVSLPAGAAALAENGEINTHKGPVFHTAIIAGTQAAKRTHELIPFCHPLKLEGCRIAIDLKGNGIRIDCAVKVTGKTGAEMEALTGATVAALTVYDMLKSVSRGIEITRARLIGKSGGKSDYGDGGGG